MFLLISSCVNKPDVVWDLDSLVGKKINEANEILKTEFSTDTLYFYTKVSTFKGSVPSRNQRFEFSKDTVSSTIKQPLFRVNHYAKDHNTLTIKYGLSSNEIIEVLFVTKESYENCQSLMRAGNLKENGLYRIKCEPNDLAFTFKKSYNSLIIYF